MGSRANVLAALFILITFRLSLFSFKSCHAARFSKKFLWLLRKRILKISVCKLTFSILVFARHADVVVNSVILDDLVLEVVYIGVIAKFVIIS
jgi:hypothetical protein